MFTNQRPLAYSGRPSDERSTWDFTALIPAIHHRTAAVAAAAAEEPTADWGAGIHNNKDQSNLVKSGIASRLYPPVGSSNLQLHVLAGGSSPQIFPSPGSQLTQSVIGPHQCTCQKASKSIERFKQGEAWKVIDRHATLRRNVYIAIGGIACERTIPPNK